ncbi:MAG: hypothetical protein U1A26_01440, partial [Candidatus Sungbacteria bacterium]|nr:hypothetical protein [Candidatus Sungbacteria bacterium]
NHALLITESYIPTTISGTDTVPEAWQAQLYPAGMDACIGQALWRCMQHSPEKCPGFKRLVIPWHGTLVAGHLK